MDWLLSGSSVHGTLQARILEWVAIPSSRGSSWPRDLTWVSYTAGGFWATQGRLYYCGVHFKNAGCQKSPFLRQQKKKTKPWVWSSVQFSRSVVSDSATPWTAAHQASLSITNSQTLLKLTSIESVMPSTISSSVIPFSSRPQSFPASGSSQMSQLFTSGNQSIGVSASASVLSMNIQDWFPLGWIGWISLQSKGLSRVFSNTTVQKHQFFGTQLSL